MGTLILALDAWIVLEGLRALANSRPKLASAPTPAER